MSESQDREYERIRDRMQQFNMPPVTPKEDMWPAIQASWQAQARDRRVARVRNRWLRYAVGAAALVMLGVAIGRWSTVQTPASPVPAIATNARSGTPDASLTHRLAASRHFSQAETLLLLFETDTGDEDVAPLARSLLTTTRLLLDSQAADDLRIRDLLLDLELVLSQMVILQPGNDTGERELITESLDGNSLLPRLRNLIPTTPVRRAGA